MSKTDPTQASDQYQQDMALFRVVHEIASRHAGRPVGEVMGVLRRRLPGVPGLDDGEIRRIAEQINVGRDPSGI
ncbi:MAG TPA: hypothetical protein VIR33_06640 [Thermopolyspora sp.]|jgi:hypothetical protein